jgi:hypothetical protein
MAAMLTDRFEASKQLSNAFALPVPERVKIAHELLLSLDDGAGASEAWVAELEQAQKRAVDWMVIAAKPCRIRLLKTDRGEVFDRHRDGYRFMLLRNLLYQDIKVGDEGEHILLAGKNPILQIPWTGVGAE